VSRWPWPRGGRSECGGEINRGIDLAHPLAAPSRDRLHEHGIADRLGLSGEALDRLVRPVIARRHRHAGGAHQLLGRVLQPHRADAGGPGADPDQPGVDRGLREVRILREEPGDQMNGIRAGLPGRRDDLVSHQIALRRRRGADMHRLVGRAHMERPCIGIGIDDDRCNPHGSRGAHDPAGDLASVGDQELGDHGAYIQNTPKAGHSAIGASRHAAKASPSTSRVCTGSTTPIVPQARGGVARVALVLVFLADRGLERLGLIGRPRISVAVDSGEHGCVLLAAHHRDARIGPCEQEAGE